MKKVFIILIIFVNVSSLLPAMGGRGDQKGRVLEKRGPMTTDFSSSSGAGFTVTVEFGYEGINEPDGWVHKAEPILYPSIQITKSLLNNNAEIYTKIGFLTNYSTLLYNDPTYTGLIFNIGVSYKNEITSYSYLQYRFLHEMDYQITPDKYIYYQENRNGNGYKGAYGGGVKYNIAFDRIGDLYADSYIHQEYAEAWINDFRASNIFLAKLGFESVFGFGVWIRSDYSLSNLLSFNSEYMNKTYLGTSINLYYVLPIIPLSFNVELDIPYEKKYGINITPTIGYAISNTNLWFSLPVYALGNSINNMDNLISFTLGFSHSF